VEKEKVEGRTAMVSSEVGVDGGRFGEGYV
jgi:hypothetical protein